MEEDGHIFKMARRKLAQLLKQALLLTEISMEESDSEEEVSRQLTSRKNSQVWTADSLVAKCITWPHELVYTSVRQPAMYEKFFMPLFISGYIAMLDTVKSGLTETMLKHLWEWMADAATYGWEPV